MFIIISGEKFRLIDQFTDINVILTGSRSSSYFTYEILPRLKELSEYVKLMDNVKIIIIYTSEANPIDEYSVSNLIKINQHVSIEDRINQAKCIDMNINDPMIQILSDSLEAETSFSEKFSAWSERGFVISKSENNNNNYEKTKIESKSSINDFIIKYLSSNNS